MAVASPKVEEAVTRGRARLYRPHSNRKYRTLLAPDDSVAATLIGTDKSLGEPDPILQHWPESERPTYRAIQCGIESLSDVELISVLLRTGTGRESAVATARRLLQEGGGLQAAVTNAFELSSEQAARLVASLELAR